MADVKVNLALSDVTEYSREHKVVYCKLGKPHAPAALAAAI